MHSGSECIFVKLWFCTLVNDVRKNETFSGCFINYCVLIEFLRYGEPGCRV